MLLIAAFSLLLFGLLGGVLAPFEVVGLLLGLLVDGLVGDLVKFALFVFQLLLLDKGLTLSLVFLQTLFRLLHLFSGILPLNGCGFRAGHSLSYLVLDCFHRIVLGLDFGLRDA